MKPLQYSCLPSLALLAVLAFLSRAHAQEWGWATRAGGPEAEYVYTTAVDADGNTFAVGQFYAQITFGDITLTSAGQFDLFVAKYSPQGEVLWAHRAGSSGFLDVAHGVVADAAGNAYVTGKFTGTSDFGPFLLTSQGGNDVFLAKYAPDGEILWVQQSGGSFHDEGLSVALDPEGNPVVTGIFGGMATFGDVTLTSAGGSDVFLAKFSPTGQVLGATRVGGGPSTEYGDAVAVSASGDVYVAGGFTGTATFGSTTLTSAGNLDVFVAKVSPAGEVLWARRGGGTGEDEAYALGLNAAGEAYVTGPFYGVATFGPHTLVSAGNADVFLAKYSPSGDVLWARRDGGVFGDYGEGVAVDPAGNAYVTGYFYESATFGSQTVTSAGDADIFVAGYAADGTARWATRVGGTSTDWFSHATLVGTDVLRITGTFKFTIEIGTSTLVSVGLGDIFVASLTGVSPAAVVVAAEPASPPVVIGPGGGSFEFTVTLTNTTGQSQAFQAWSEVTGPMDREPVLGPITLTLQAGATVTRTLRQRVPGAAPAGTYTYAVHVGTFPGTPIASSTFSVTKQAGALAAHEGDAVDAWAVGGWDATPASASLAGAPNAAAFVSAFPNPFSQATRVAFTTTAAGPVRLTVYDMLGREVARLADGQHEAGTHAVAFEAADLPNGTYFIQLTTGSTVQTLRLARIE